MEGPFGEARNAFGAHYKKSKALDILENMEKDLELEYKQQELIRRVLKDPAYLEAEEKYKLVCEVLDKKREEARKEKEKVFKEVAERIAPQLGLMRKTTEA